MRFHYKPVVFLTLLGVLSTALALAPSGWLIPVAHAQTAPTPPPNPDLTAAREAELRAQLDAVLKEIAAQQVILNDEQAKGASFARDISILNAQIKQAQLTIRAHEIAIQGLGSDISKKVDTIKDLQEKIDKNRISLAELIRKTALTDSRSLVEIILSDSNLSNFFTELNEYNALKQAVKSSSESIRSDKTTTEIE